MNSIIENQIDNPPFRVGIIIPDRGDRPKFLANCLRMMKAQTLQPVDILVVDYAPESTDVDITQRYKRGYDALKNKGLDIIAFIENDDWYHPTYLEKMVWAWDSAGRPDLFGTNYTIYYHMRLRKYYKLLHHDRASMMNTFIRPDMQMAGIWPIDKQPFTDMAIWSSKLKGLVFSPPYCISLGMKHGIGKTGGRAHTDNLEKYTRKGFEDPHGNFIQSTMDPDSFAFYWNYDFEN